MDDVFKALADPTRRKLLDRLHADNGQTLGGLCEHLNMKVALQVLRLLPLVGPWLTIGSP